jgi:hypothetical protein
VVVKQRIGKKPLVKFSSLQIQYTSSSQKVTTFDGGGGFSVPNRLFKYLLLYCKRDYNFESIEVSRFQQGFVNNKNTSSFDKDSIRVETNIFVFLFS